MPQSGPKPKRHITGARALSVAGLAQAPWFKVLARVLTVTGTVYNAGGPAGCRGCCEGMLCGVFKLVLWSKGGCVVWASLRYTKRIHTGAAKASLSRAPTRALCL